jgi:hypothetical protein
VAFSLFESRSREIPQSVYLVCTILSRRVSPDTFHPYLFDNLASEAIAKGTPSNSSPGVIHDNGVKNVSGRRTPSVLCKGMSSTSHAGYEIHC